MKKLILLLALLVCGGLVLAGCTNTDNTASPSPDNSAAVGVPTDNIGGTYPPTDAGPGSTSNNVPQISAGTGGTQDNTNGPATSASPGTTP